MKKQHVVAVIIGVVLLVAFLLFSSKTPSDDQEKSVDSSPPPKVSSESGLSKVASQPAEQTDEAKLEVEKLWPHLKKEQPTEAQREKVRAEWKNFAAKYPANIYIPNEFKPPLTEAEAKVAKQQLDDVTSMAAQNAAMRSVDRNRTAAGSNKAPDEITEKQAREKGITPEQQSNFFSYKIKELESRIQLGEFSLTSSEMDSTQKAAMTKEMTVWKKELEELIKVKAQVPKS